MTTKTFQTIPRNVWVLGFVSLLTDISSEMIHSVLPLFLVSVLGADLLTVGWIEGIAESTASVLKVFSGALSDYLGQRKRLAVAGYGLSTLVKPLFALATSPASVLIARFGDRVGKGIRVAPRDAIVADVTDSVNRGAAYGLRQSLDTIGAFTGPLVAFMLMYFSGQNFRLVFWLAVLPGILAVALLATGVREPGNRNHQRQNNPLHWSALQSLGKSYWVLVAVALLFNLGNSSDAFLLLQAQQAGVSASLVPLTLVVMNIAYSLSAYPVGLLSDRIGRLGLLVSGFCVYALAYLGFAFVNAPWQVWGLFGLYGLHQGMSQGILLALVADRVPSHLRGTAFGLINLATGAALLPASLLGGVLWQTISPKATFIAGSIFALSAIALLLVFESGRWKSVDKE
ncbi:MULTISPECIES: MFS transporter [Nostocales]|uniref:MFS transporter n=1 Tax=Nostoc punctiforme FACHB-252 TaxID=1357509 RepID=A0ABR8HFI2_NOSPU|nr:MULTISPECIES: MFS transporter [Nostocales]BAY95118.1 major facilitator transporter [Microchaete diplosiphon NIES-3275]MBD2614016.1 MFS transporter [Nostoc punctiforme FACHB-252]MBE9080678.1 MFS transporter [Tolypothrix sp. LEGE 11397]UYD30367.1 MFS transporter [Tolypothrix sp. PCC 7712]UYD38191.1 MFS transporter [Tolypothrix sp. PCC 7601]